jgi:hypothetical protein
MEDVLDVYQRPYDPARPVVCLDEKSKQLLGDAREPLPPRPGQPAREDYEYHRHGTVNVFVAFEPLCDRRQLEVTARRTKRDWAAFIKALVDGRYREARRVVLVMDNLNTHSPASLYEAFEPPEAKRLADKLEIHYTPKHGSWLNMAEIEISALSRQLPRRAADASSFMAACKAAEVERNERRAGVDWRFTTTDARIKLKRLYPSQEVR